MPPDTVPTMARRVLFLLCLVTAALACGGGYGGGGNNNGGNPYNPDPNVPNNPNNPNNPNDPYDPNQPAAPGANEVFARSSTFDPTVRTVTAGTTVTWRNVSLDSHTVTPDGHTQFARREINNQGSTTSVIFNVPGTYLYFCEVHGSPGAGMNGRIVVR